MVARFFLFPAVTETLPVVFTVVNSVRTGDASLPVKGTGHPATTAVRDSVHDKVDDALGNEWNDAEEGIYTREWGGWEE